MSTYTFGPGERIKMNQELYHLRRKLDGGRWQLEKDADGQYVIMDEAELRDKYFQSVVSFVSSYMENKPEDSDVEAKIEKNFSDYPEKLQLEAKIRLKYVKSIEGTTGVIAEAEIDKTAKELGAIAPDISTVYRWAARLRKSSDNICSLLPNFQRRGNRVARFPDEVIKIAIDKVNKVYMQDSRNSEDETISAIRDAVEVENRGRPAHKKLPKPQRKFLRKIIAAMDAYEVKCAREGKNAAKKFFREANRSGEIIPNPLDRIEIDHTKLDLIIVDTKSYLPLGRPTLSVALDRNTRCICGYYVSYEPPSYISVMKCLAHAIKPKDYMKREHPKILNPWLCWGIPQQVVADNAMEFHSKDFEAAAMSLLIDIRYCPVGEPWWKGCVERFFRTLSKSLIHRAPGSTFSNIQDRGDNKPLRDAVMTETDLHELLHTWICDVYHQTPNRSTLRTPHSLWLERINTAHQTLPASVEMLDVSLSSIENRTIFHYGVSLNNLNYNSPELQKLRKKYGEIKVDLRWDRSNLGFVYVLDIHANVYLKVPCTWFSYASGLSLWLHTAIRAEAMSHEGPESQTKLDEAKARIREMYRKALENKKLVTRTTAARAELSFSADSHSTPYSAQTVSEVLNTPETRVAFNVDEGDQEEDIPDFEVSERNAA